MFPSSIDSLPDVSTGDIITASHENAQSAAILAVENTLGINPQGGYSTVADYLAALAAAIASTCDLRLTLVSGNPVGTDNDSGSTIYLSPYVGTGIALYDTGTSSWTRLDTGEISLDISGLSDGIYDIFAYNNSGSPTLEVSDAWGYPNDRTDGLTQQDGVWVKSADYSRRLVGTTNVSSGATSNSQYSGRYVWNAQHRVPLHTIGSLANWSSDSDSWSNILAVTYLVGLITESIIAVSSGLGQGDPLSSAQCELAMGQSTVVSPDSNGNPVASAQETTFLGVTYVALPGAIGLQTVNLFARSSVDLVTVSLLQEDASFSGVWMNATTWV